MQCPSQITTTNKPTPNFLQVGCPSCRQTNSVKALLFVIIISQVTKQAVQTAVRPPRYAPAPAMLQSNHHYQCTSGCAVEYSSHHHQRCTSGCVVECRVCNREVAGSNLSLGYFASRSAQPSIPQESVNEYQLRLGKQRQVWLIPIADERVGVQVKL